MEEGPSLPAEEDVCPFCGWPCRFAPPSPPSAAALDRQFRLCLLCLLGRILQNLPQW